MVTRQTHLRTWMRCISALREAFNKGNSTVGQEMTLKAILVNAPNANNNSSKNLVLSDGKAGIMVRLSDNGLKAGEINPGDQVEVAKASLNLYPAVQQWSIANRSTQECRQEGCQYQHACPYQSMTSRHLMSDKIKGELESRLGK